jgi:AsmA family protein
VRYSRMDAPALRRAALQWLVGAAVTALALFLLAAWALDSRWLGLILIHHVAAKTERKVRIDGPVAMRFFSRTPQMTVEGITIGNPPWAPPGTSARIGELRLIFSWPSLSHGFVLRAIAMRSAEVFLWRGANGNSNWQWAAPGIPPGPRPPIIHGLSVPDAAVRLDDQDLHLQFTGKVSAGDGTGTSGRGPLRIAGAGQLNGRPVDFTIEADPLASVRRGAAYHFVLEESSSGSRLAARGSLPRPFDFSQLDAGFQAQGEDLKDLYFLTGVSLLDTGPYRLTGKLQQRGALVAFRDLSTSSGGSDMGGTVLVHRLGNGNVFADLDLRSERLQLTDLGRQAAGRAPAPRAKHARLISDTPFGLRRFRQSNARARIRCHDFLIGNLDLHALAAAIAFQHGAILAKPVSATLAGGRLSGEARIDLTREVPELSVNLHAADVQLGELPRREAAHAATAERAAQPNPSARSPPPLEGPLEARLTLTGRGDSLHALASTAEGRITAVLPHGAIEASIAELAGLDFARWLGVRLGTRQNEATVRCGIASFSARGGTLGIERLMIDTGPALIVGSGDINLDSETLDVTLRDEPTHLRLLHKRLPVRIGGTLQHPSLSAGALGKVGAKAALGAVLAPIEAIVHFINPQLTKNADCAAVLTAPGRAAWAEQ